MKRISAIICFLLVAILLVLLFGCSSKDNYKDDYVNFAFDYFEEHNIPIFCYDVEEYESINMNVDAGGKLFDEGKICKITMYVDCGSNECEFLYFVGMLNGEKVLYRYDDGTYSHLVKVA